MSFQLQESNNIATLIFDQADSKVNILTAENIKRLDQILDEVKGKNYKALIIKSRKRDCFIAGADIKEIEKIVEPKDGAAKAKAGQDVMNKIEDLPFPTFAVIDGVALGGGCELALSCDYRLSSFNPKVKIGLPEVNLGFVPGFGGTYRLPRIIGLSESLKMILAGSQLNSSKALRVGLFDKLFPQLILDKEVQAFVDAVVAGKINKKKYSPPKARGIMGFLEGNRFGHNIIFSQSRKNVMKLSKGFYPAPLKAIEVIKQNYYCGRDRGMDIECRAFGELAITDISKNLVHLFYISEKYRKLQLDELKDVAPITVKKAAVLGAGVMGGGIAQLLSANGILARIKDVNYDAIAKGFQAASKVYHGALKRRKATKAEVEMGMGRITGTLDYSGFKDVDIVIEAVVEKMEVKQKVFREMDTAVSSKTVLATNTSALSVAEMAKVTSNPSRVVGVHFFNPVHRMPLIEVITTEATSKEALATTLGFVKRLRKIPIVVKDSAGFIVNRILLAYMNEAGRIMEETHDIEGIDKAVLAFGMPMGPFRLSDEVGLDVGIKVLQILEEAFGERFTPVKTFHKVYEAGLLGKKVSKGFYVFDGKKESFNTDVKQFLTGSAEPLNSKACVDRVILSMINEAAMCLEDGIVDDPAAIDVGMIFGTGFPPFRGGLLKYADSLGIDNVVESLQNLCENLNTSRFKPSEYLVKLQREGRTFYS